MSRKKPAEKIGMTDSEEKTLKEWFLQPCRFCGAGSLAAEIRNFKGRRETLEANLEKRAAQLNDDERQLDILFQLPPDEPGFPKKLHATEQEYARFSGLNQSTVSRMLQRGVLTQGAPWRIWAIQHIGYLKGLAAGRRGSGY